MKLKKLFLASILPFFLLSCKTTGLIPGEKEIIKLNLHSEYLLIADENFSLKNYSKAETFYKKAMEVEELYWEAYYKLGKTYVMQKKYIQALSVYEELLNRDPENYTVKETIAYLYAMNCQKEKAIDSYKELIEKNGETSSYYESLLIIYIQNKEKEQAEQLFSTLKEKFPDCSNLNKYETELQKLEN